MSDDKVPNGGERYDKGERWEYPLGDVLELNQKYHVKMEGRHGTVTFYLYDANGKHIGGRSRKTKHLQRKHAKVWVGDNVFDAADATVSNLKIGP